MDSSTRSVRSTDTLDDYSLHGMVTRSRVDEAAARRLRIRKKQEMKLVKKYDKSEIDPGRECWYLIDSKWLNQWAAFCNSEDEEPPYHISSKELLDEKGEPLPGLKAKIDYRGVVPMVFFILVELHGRDNSPEIMRYKVDIYAPPLTIDRIIKHGLKNSLDARLQVQRIRKKWTDWDVNHYPDDPDDDPACCKCCCFNGLTKEHFEAFLYWAAYCCFFSRRRAGRADISYSSYRPLRNIDSGHGMDSSHGSNRGSVRGGSSSHGGGSQAANDADEEEEGKDDQEEEVGESGSTSSDDNDDDLFEIGNAEEGYGRDAWYGAFFGAGGGGTNSNNNSSHGNSSSHGNGNSGTDGVVGDTASNPLHPGSSNHGSSQGGSSSHGGSVHGGSSHGRLSSSSHGSSSGRR
jgi:uncharacterized membrane protein YgcG